MLYPFEDHVWAYPVNHWLEFMEHICPFGLTTIDWILNPMRYEKSTVAINLIVVSLYGVLNITFTKVTGSPVYPPFITWDSPLSWTIGFALIPLFAGVFYLEYWLTNIKLKKLY